MPHAPKRHRPAQRHQEDRPCASQRGYGAAWRKRRAEQLSREPLCAECLKAGELTPATVADHIEPHKGDMAAFRSGELQSLCKPHHDAKTRRGE